MLTSRAVRLAGALTYSGLGCIFSTGGDCVGLAVGDEPPKEWLNGRLNLYRDNYGIAYI
jgi:hypothetical protein